MHVARLRVLNSPLRGQEFPIPDRPVIVGRSSSCDVVLADQSVSRQHVRIEARDAACLVTDLGSQNGIVIRGETLREALLGSGDRFELGDVELELVVEPAAQPAPAAPAAPPPGPEAAAGVFAPPATVQPAGPPLAPGERAVLVDEIFGAAVTVEERGPGEEEKAAVEGARGAAKYVLLLVLILAVGTLAWYVAGGIMPNVPVKSVLVKAGGVTVIDLGLSRDSSGLPFIDERETYDTVVPNLDPEEQAAAVELDGTGFLAAVRGIALGTCDVTILGPRDRKAILRILVRDVVARPAGEERLSIEERIAKGRTIMSSAETAQRSGYLYRASARYREALIILEPTKGARNAEADALRQQADRLGLAARKQLDGEFEKIKFQAVAKYLNRDLIGAAKAWEKLQNLIPDEEDEMSQKLRLIFDRTIYMLQRSNR